MAVRASTRLSIRWPPAEASEPTDTLVLSIGEYYVDLRAAKSGQSIDWALAGQQTVISEDPRELMVRRMPCIFVLSRSCTSNQRINADVPQVKVEFTHPYDSHYVEDQEEGAPDIGEFSKLPNGDDLETGVMAATHLGGKILPYEEVWRELDPSSGSAGSDAYGSSWILESTGRSKTAEDGTAIKSYYGKVGKYFLALRSVKRSNPSSLKFSAIRQDWNADEAEWVTKYKIGDVDGIFVLSKDLSAESAWKVGDEVTVGPSEEVCVVKAVGSV